MEVRGQLVEVSCFHHVGSKDGTQLYQAWQQVPLPTNPLTNPQKLLFLSGFTILCVSVWVCARKHRCRGQGYQISLDLELQAAVYQPT